LGFFWDGTIENCALFRTYRPVLVLKRHSHRVSECQSFWPVVWIGSLTPSTASECVLPQDPRVGDTHSLGGKGGGANSDEEKDSLVLYFLIPSLEATEFICCPRYSAAAARSSIRRRCLGLPPPGSGNRIQCSPTRRRRNRRAWSIEEGRGLCECQSSQKLSKNQQNGAVSNQLLEVRGVAIVNRLMWDKEYIDTLCTP
jgi:hypothetical protein